MRFNSGCFTAGVALIAAAAPLSAQAFEGRIAFKVSGENGSSRDMQYQVRDNKVRFDAPGGGGQSMAIVLDPVNQKTLILMSAQKMYMEQTLTVPANNRVSEQAGAHSITATGRKETIAGYPCEHFTFTDDAGANYDACIAHGLGSFLQAPSGNLMTGRPSSGADDWSAKIGKDAFPLRVTKGNATIMEVTKIEKASLDPSLFAVPDGWKKFELPNIPGMRRPPPQQ